MAAPVGTGNLTITGVPDFNVGSVMKCTEAPTWTGDAPPYTFQYIWKYRPYESNSSDDWVRGSWTVVADPSAANLPTFPIDAGDLEYQLGIKCTDDNGDNSARYSSPTGPSTQPASAGQYVARNVDNTPKDPQPGDTEIEDKFGNIFDNFNTDWVARNVDNTALNPQPAYQNGNYVQRTVTNTVASPTWEQDAGQWVARNVENQVRTPAAYVRSPLWPDGAPASYSPKVSFIAVLEAEHGLAYIVDEDDVNTIDLQGVSDLEAVANYI